MPLFEVAILQKEKQTKEERDAGDSATERLILDVTTILAKTPEIAGHKAIMQAAKVDGFDLDRAEVTVRPFA